MLYIRAPQRASTRLGRIVFAVEDDVGRRITAGIQAPLAGPRAVSAMRSP